MTRVSDQPFPLQPSLQVYLFQLKGAKNDNNKHKVDGLHQEVYESLYVDFLVSIVNNEKEFSKGIHTQQHKISRFCLLFCVWFINKSSYLYHTNLKVN